MTRAVRPPTSLMGAILVLCATAIAAGVHAEAGDAVEVEALEVRFDVRAPDENRFGRLEWRGGIEILSDHPDFGGFSGLVVSPDGARLLAVSDRGRWFEAAILYRDGMLASVAQARTARVLGADGTPLEGKDNQDAEGLAPATRAGFDGPVLMALEREERILRFDFGAFAFDALPSTIALPDEAALGPYNGELEAVAVLAGGGGETLIAISERHLDADGNIRGWLLGATSGHITVARSGDYDVTDIASLPGGDLIVLERRLSVLMLAGMRMRRIARGDIAPGAILEGEVLLEASQPLAAIDNMEAVAVHVTAHGEVRLTLMSDDNFNPLQRTLLLQFTLPD